MGVKNSMNLDNRDWAACFDCLASADVSKKADMKSFFSSHIMCESGIYTSLTLSHLDAEFVSSDSTRFHTGRKISRSTSTRQPVKTARDQKNN